MQAFFQTDLRKLTTSPNQRIWWHAMPLPDGSRIDSVHPDKELQLKMWNALGLAREGMTGKTVLDIGAADGFFSIAVSMARRSRHGDWHLRLVDVAAQYQARVEGLECADRDTHRRLPDA